ncbi:MAG: hypothetical protein FJ100_00580 [Deltaproteobacteria bacterium]|nr:hypothetical protein [Deltaproteobacteria bacterium]
MGTRCRWLAAVAATWACNSSVPVQSYTYACSATDQCAPGWACVGGRCTRGGAARAADSAQGSVEDVAGAAEDAQGHEAAAAEVAAETAMEAIADAKPVCGATDSACLTSCAVQQCPMQGFACNQDPECLKVVTCYVACKDTPCRASCIGSASPGTKGKVEDLAKCLAANCM